MKDMLRRCLALVLVVSLVLGTGVTGAFAASPGASAVDTENALVARPDPDQALLRDTMADAMNGITGFDADENVIFIVELEGSTLLDTKPAKQTVGEYMASAAGASAAKAIALQQAAVQSQIANAPDGLKVEYTYQVILNGLAVSGPRSAAAYLRSLAGVASVTEARTYEYVEPVDADTGAAVTSGAMMDSDSANAAGYTGKGTVTAILDTGLDLTHEAFANDPAEPAMDLADIEAAVATGNLNALVTADQLYKSAKIPFAYDYTSDDADVDDPNDHGTHVAGTVGASCAELSGVAPDTQLVIMKVFNDEGSGATDAVIFAALEDAVVLGVDAVNMSLGTPGGFTYEDEVTDAVYSAVRDAGINLMVSAGNETSATYNNNLGTHLPLVSEPDNGIVGSPSTYAASLSVASVNEYSDYITYILSGDRQIRFTDGNMETALDFVKTFDGQTLEYVFVPGFGGTVDDFDAAGVSGKIAVVARGGEVAFTDKEANAAAAGAVGLIVFDNVEGDLIYMASNGDIPAVFIAKADGLALRDQADKTISVSTDYHMFTETADGGLMSGFSSLGVAPDMSLKPEITAPGGYVYSSLPGGVYGSMSGTSMASPHMAGAAAVMQQYVDEAFAGLSATEKQSLINTLLMNTAAAVEDEYGVAYTPRKQGAGLAQVSSAINTGAYVTVDGSDRPKAELGDSPDGTFAKEVTLTIHNVSGADLTYNMSAMALTAMEEEVNVGGVKYNCISDHARVMPAEELAISFSADTVTVAAGSTASVTVSLTLTDAGAASLANFVNGTFLDGFIVLESADEGGIDLSVPYLGFYGDWGAASVFDDTIYDGETASTYASAMALLDLSTGNGYYLGSNFYTDGESYDINKAAVSREMLASGYRPFTLLGLLRGPKTLTYTVTDAAGNALELIDELDLTSYGTSYTVDNVIKSFYYSGGGYINYEMGPLNYGWNAIEDLGEGFYSWREDGQYYINVTAQVDGTDSPAGTQTTSFPITIDSKAPQLVGHDFEEVDGVPYVTLDFYDENYVMAFQIVSRDGLQAFSPAIPVDEAEPGTTSSYTFDTSALLAAGHTSACVYVYDYALNGYSSYEFSLESDNLQPIGVYINNQDVSVSGAQTFEIEAWIEPEGLEAAENVLTWTSSDETIATVRDTGRTRYDEDASVTFHIAEVTTYDVGGTVTITAATVNGKTASTNVTVVSTYTALPEDNVIRQDGTYKIPADLNTQITITDEARNVTIVGNEANTADAPYKDLSLKSEVAGLNLTIRDLNVTSTVYSSWGTPAAAPTITFTGTGNTLTVQGESTFVGVSYGSLALIQVDTGVELTVNGTGTLNLYQPGNTNGAALGSQAGYACGTIVIDGGTLNVTTEGYGAGIGGGAGANAPSITINGGTVNADSRYATAGYSTNENYAGAAIGAGNGASGGTNKITINGGSVTASTSTNSAAIGGAMYSSWSQGSDASFITVNGGKVVASTRNEGGTSNGGGAAIGSAYYGGTASITVGGGEVIALTETAAAAIGGGYQSKAPTITVNGGTVSALANSANSSSAYRGPAMGKGAYGTAGYAYISGGAVLAAGNADNNFNASVYNGDYEAVVEVALTLPGVECLSINGTDWKVSANHADFTAEGGSDYSAEVHVWLPEALSTPYTAVAVTGNGTEQFELYTNGNTYKFHNVTYALTGLTVDGPAKVYDASAGDGYAADLTGTLAVEDAETMVLPQTITVTVGGEAVEASYDPATGAFTVAKELLTGEVVITAAAAEKPAPAVIASGWSGYTTWALTEDGVLTFSPTDQTLGGQCNLRNYWKVNGVLTLPWGAYADMITAVVIEDGIHDVGQMAFYELQNLETVTLGADVVEIRNYAFKNCIALTTVTGTEGLQNICEGAFYGCSSLTELAVPEGCAVGDWAFGGSCPIAP